MKKLLIWLVILFAVGLCALTIYGVAWIRQYQQLAMGDFFDSILK